MTNTQKTYKRLSSESVIDWSATYAVMATYKDEPGEPFVKTTGTWEECDDYVERNTSPDNNERYYVALEVA